MYNTRILLYFCQTEEKYNQISESYAILCDEHKIFLLDSSEKSEAYDKHLSELTARFTDMQGEIDKLKNIRYNLKMAVETLNNKLAGVITCPSCGFEFILSDKVYK